MTRIAVVLVDRANYGRLQPLIDELVTRPVTLQVIAGGSMLLERFKQPVELVEQQLGRPVDYRVWCELEGSTPGTMSRSIAAAVSGFTEAYENLQPDYVVIIGDRYEALGAAIAAAYTHRKIVHLQGGESSGCIDDKCRHAITQLADCHVPATNTAAVRLRSMGVPQNGIISIGCPVADIAERVKIGAPKPYLLVQYHPNTKRYGNEDGEVQTVLDAVAAAQMPVRWFWPNIDAGSQHIHKRLRMFRDKHDLDWEWIRNTPPLEYQWLLANAAVAVGNSSSFVRDSGFYGTPVVLVGDRQLGRQAGDNVKLVPLGTVLIRKAIEEQLEHGRYPRSELYGKPGVSHRIADAICRLAGVSVVWQPDAAACTGAAAGAST